MVRQIECPCLASGRADVRIITTKEEARDNETFFYQLTSFYRQLTDRIPKKDIICLVGARTHFVFLTEGTNLIGSATLALIETAITRRGIVEDVVVDQRYRGAHLGQTLLQEVIKLARLKGCKCLQLTSKPERAGTSSFYPKLGFEAVAFARTDHPEGTNLYRMDL